MRYDFAGKLVLVTGAGHGLGRAIAVAFAGLGAEVVALDLNEDGLSETVREARERCQGRRLDVTKRDAVQALCAEIERRHGPASILVNCAGGVFGITVNSIAPGFVRSNPTTERQWQAMGAEGQARLVESIALRRLGTPADIVHGVLFFASDFAAWITGQVLSVDGGR